MHHRLAASASPARTTIFLKAFFFNRAESKQEKRDHQRKETHFFLAGPFFLAVK